MKIKILHISKDLVGGIGTVIVSLIKSFNNHEFSSESLIWDNPIVKNSIIIKVITKYLLLKKNITNNIDYHILHFHGGFTPHIMLMNKFKNKPILLSPHGALDQTSLKKSKLKKILVKYLFMKKAYQSANCIHALTNKEAKDIKCYGIKDVPIAIIPNGIDMDVTLGLNQELKIKLLSLAKGKKIILSLSRLHISKGIDILIEAFTKVYEINKDIVLFIVGAGDEEYEAQLGNKIKDLKQENNIFLLGEMINNDKNTLYDISNIFVLPSFNEGFPLTVLEAYRQNVPVITTTATPFEPISKIGCGWYVEPALDKIYLALEDASLLSKSELKVKGNIGHEWIKNNYSLNAIMKMYEELYLWLINNSEKPNFVYEGIKK